jgi:hypothetical protein
MATGMPAPAVISETGPRRASRRCNRNGAWLVATLVAAKTDTEMQVLANDQATLRTHPSRRVDRWRCRPRRVVRGHRVCGTTRLGRSNPGRTVVDDEVLPPSLVTNRQCGCRRCIKRARMKRSINVVSASAPPVLAFSRIGVSSALAFVARQVADCFRSRQ